MSQETVRDVYGQNPEKIRDVLMIACLFILGRRSTEIVRMMLKEFNDADYMDGSKTWRILVTNHKRMESGKFKTSAFT